MATVERFFAFDHAATRGHFPGNPIIPGAFLLSESLRAIEASLNLGGSPLRLVSAKFLYPARPGDRVSIEFSDSASGVIRFACTAGQKMVLTGVAAWTAL